MRKVVLCGLGAVGLTLGVKLNSADEIDLEVVADINRFNRFKNKPPILNNVVQNFKYKLPDDLSEKADLIIISTKFNALDSAIKCVEKSVGDKTRIISLINGVSSEGIIMKSFPDALVLKSYFIGHSAVRENNSVKHDGVGRIVTQKDEVLEEIFKTSGIDYLFAENIDYKLWVKFALNVCANQISAILNLTFGEMKNNSAFLILAKKIISEVKSIAVCVGINNLNNYEADVLKALSGMCDEGKTSMLQDILAGRKTELDIFAGEVIRLGKLYNVPTPYNQVLYDLIKIKEENNEHSVYSC